MINRHGEMAALCRTCDGLPAGVRLSWPGLGVAGDETAALAAGVAPTAAAGAAGAAAAPGCPDAATFSTFSSTLAARLVAALPFGATRRALLPSDSVLISIWPCMAGMGAH